jgi:hypothetical protein
MQTTLNVAVESYLRAKTLSRGSRNEYRSTLRKWACHSRATTPACRCRNEYRSTLRKWEQWGSSVPIEVLRRKDIREFLDWVYERAVADEGTNPGRTANKAREYLRASNSR